jgi:hypothetical protein
MAPDKGEFARLLVEPSGAVKIGKEPVPDHQGGHLSRHERVACQLQGR